MSLFSRFLDKLRYSEFYVHHTGFGGWLVLTLMNKRNLLLGAKIALHEDAAKRGKFRDINAGMQALYVELFADQDSEKDRFVVLGFDHHYLTRRNRVDLFLSPGGDREHIHARLTASRRPDGEQSETLFDGEVALFDDSFEEPFMMHTQGA